MLKYIYIYIHLRTYTHTYTLLCWVRDSDQTPCLALFPPSLSTHLLLILLTGKIDRKLKDKETHRPVVLQHGHSSEAAV